MNETPDGASSTTDGIPSATYVNTPAPSEPAQGKDWQAAYAGLQRAYQKLQTETDAKIKDLEEKLSIATSGAEKLRKDAEATITEREALRAQHDSAMRKNTEMETQLKAAQRESKRASMIAAEFPRLAPFAKLGVLPDSDDENQLREMLKAFEGTAASFGATGVSQQMSGAVPGSISTGSQLALDQFDEEAVFQQMLNSAGKPEEYAKWQQRWDELWAKKNAPKKG